MSVYNAQMLFTRPRYGCTAENNCEQYENKLLSAADILYDVWQHATIFLNENPENFAQWGSRNKLDFLNRSSKRPANSSNQRTPQRSLFVLKEELKCNVIEDIINLKQKHQDYIINLKTNGYTVIGYCRKSKTRNTEGEVVKSLSGMVFGLQKRSLVDEIYTSVSCNASTPIFKRDMKKNDIINKLSDVSGTAQDLIKRLKETKSFCLVVTDSSGLTTNMDDLIDLMREHKKIIIENIINANDVQVLDCEDELIKPKHLHNFDGRQNLYHRSRNN